MPYIFRFHKGINNNIYDWKASDKIGSADVKDVMDKTNILTSSAGTSIPTPIARMYLFKTAYEIMAAQMRDNSVDDKSIYAGLVSESLDLLELLYKSGSDINKFRYHRWSFENNEDALSHFGEQPGHKLLAQSFKQAASQEPFNNKINITLIYYKDGSKEVLMGGTSSFTFVFTTPNFKRKMKERGFKSINGLVSGDRLFDADYLQLHERDASFIKYVQSLINTPGIDPAFRGFSEYVTNTSRRFESKFDGILSSMQNIQFGDTPLLASNINLKQITEADYKETINQTSDFKIRLPIDSNYKNPIVPLFLLDRMVYDGQYSSLSNQWSSKTRINEIEYPETTVKEFMQRELPDLDGFRYPFLSSFDVFEKFLVKLPAYVLNDERFITLANNQSFAYPIKPLFFNFFPIHRIKEFLSVETQNNEVTFTLKIPIYGPTKGQRTIISKKTYDTASMINYGGILGIFPFTRSYQTELLYINQYTVASYEKTNSETAVEAINFFKADGISTLITNPVQRSNYTDINTKSTYYQLNSSFDIIQLNFRKMNSICGGLILPKFKEIENGDTEYIYAIDFGTSNTHIEYGRVEDLGDRKQIAESLPFCIEENTMQMYLLNKPKEVERNGGAERYNDYERSMGFTVDRARQVTLREFVPFQIGNQYGASVKFPFRTATCESNSFINNHSNNRLFIDANIGFSIDEDAMADSIRYKTDLKWLLQKASNDQFNVNRVSLFAQELMLMIRTKALLEENNKRGDISKLRIILSFPISMGDTLKKKLIEIFDTQRIEVFGKASPALAPPVTESIAPYYQLKSKNINIQNDNFCNIDIGGGTTDIVITKTENAAADNLNHLQCYCSSFRFAGRQLWSSGGNEYNSSDNGFIAYYKKFIQKVDPGVYTELEKVLNSNSIKTEDIVGLLFSKPKYKFKDIFSENKEFRVVALIHYAAILYYICKLTQLKDIALPRTVSFSGKGSEYLNLLFPANDDLKGFTQKLLGIFSGKQTRNDFIIERSDEPKVITAKGALHYAVEDVADNGGDDWGNAHSASQNRSEKKLVKEDVVYKGFKTLSFENGPMIYEDLMNRDDLYQDIIANHEEFFSLLFDNFELTKIINKKLELTDFSKYKQFFIPQNGDPFNSGVLRDSFKATIKTFSPTDNVLDPPFFFALNYSLTALSKHIANASQI